MRDPTPMWLRPEGASVTDSTMTKALRMIGSIIGADSPTAQVMGLMTTLVQSGLAGKVYKAYHGTQSAFDEFGPSTGTPIKNPHKNSGLGIFTTVDPVSASNWAGEATGANVRPLRVKIENPYVAESWGDLADRYRSATGRVAKSGEDVRGWLQSQGYDGVEFTLPVERQIYGKDRTWAVPFEPSQVESAFSVKPEVK